MTQRYCLTLDLIDDPQLIAEYRRYHEAVWPEVTECLRETGIVDMELYLLGTRLVMVMEVDERFSFENKARIEILSRTTQRSLCAPQRQRQGAGMGDADVEVPARCRPGQAR
jgi:L-rhamnose mutarotase